MRLRYGIVAGLLGRGMSTLVNIILLPFYLNVLGADAIGLIGFYTAILSLLLVFDQVLATFITRETARVSHLADSAEGVRDLIVTAEAIYASFGVLVAVALTLAAPLVAQRWLASTALSTDSVVTCIRIAGWTIPFQFLFNLHIGALVGLERQIEANLLWVCLGVLRGAFAVLAILYIRADSEIYFGAQLVAVALCLILSFVVAWRYLPRAAVRPTIRLYLFTDAWRFHSLLLVNAVLFAFIAQSDKMLVSGLLPLRVFGFYTLAAMIAALPGLIVSPIMMALLPRFSRLLAERRNSEISRLFHVASQFVAAALLPAWTIAVIFPVALVTVWTGSAKAAAEVAVILPLLMSGSVLLSLFSVPNSLALAGGWPQYQFIANLMVLPGVVLAYFLTLKWGPVGATEIWLIFGFMNISVATFLLHRHILVGEQFRWFVVDIGLPLIATIATAATASLVIPMSSMRIRIAIELTAVWAAASLAACLVSPGLRAEGFKLFRLTVLRSHRAAVGLCGGRKRK